MGRLDLRSLASLLKGSQNGPVIVEGSADASILIRKVAAGAMPPPGMGPRVDKDELERLRRWVGHVDFRCPRRQGRSGTTDVHRERSAANHRRRPPLLGFSQTRGSSAAAGPRQTPSANPDRCVRAGAAGVGRPRLLIRSAQRGLAASRLLRFDRPSAKPGRDARVPFGYRARCLRAPHQPPAGFAALRRALGPALA